MTVTSGLPTLIGRDNTASFSHIKERIWKRLQGCQGKLLNPAGEEVLIKAVVQAILLYTTSCFLLRKGFCDDLHKLMADFWWNSANGDRKIHWMSWKKLCRSKEDGGLGFRNLYAFNIATSLTRMAINYRT